jgi:hypothetical protein
MEISRLNVEYLNFALPIFEIEDEEMRADDGFNLELYPD